MSSERTVLRVPELPESVADATVVALHKQPGERVRRDELLVELETDKVVLEVPAPADGVLDEFSVEQGAVVEADTVLGYIRPAAADGGSAEDREPPAQPADADDAGPEMPAPERQPERSAAPETAPPPPSPAVRRLLAEHDLAADEIEGTGQNGRVLKGDVERFIARRAQSEPDPEPVAEAPPQPRAEPEPPEQPQEPQPAARSPEGRSEERVPMSRLRRRIAERLLEARQTTAMLTTFNEVDLSAVMDLRARHKEAFEKRHGVRLGFMSFFVRACTGALQRFPVVNAALDGDEIVYHHYADIGIAVSSPRGLVVPVLRDAGELSLAAIETQIRRFAEKARDGKLDVDDLRGGTFTITNGGVFGSLLSTPILNPPQSAILGMHAVQDRPVARDGEVVIRPMMYVALSYDHRLIDGADAVRFLVSVKDSLEDPGRMLLDL
ncbi:2-oxoglutarate dehydrogenase complex dihydrolipoyllysine-residue succinyltransferase [Thioalkalivibrio paradoxus]|uniref:Dihydrolipoyllysine-residue succinyltransferase component of 2-oxoglutarate dehydrogenase complex n=1 Tax=Thioalkalivibrio paradoxus ARh 1 TaxID=713585 RepID=W0DSE3_9GAMM|nr:2-oxoglutarate dehydrogenase complex dihydrolipoyllysine-residue succinyltransferase [Thioalkalivibrio paradoxus]AHE99770.1 dihydrolipoamide succinyltransferase [Thioalkalivibrio paradoxus ARh 1]